jgi:hypothetical protein
MLILHRITSNEFLIISHSEPICGTRLEVEQGLRDLLVPENHIRSLFEELDESVERVDNCTITYRVS